MKLFVHLCQPCPGGKHPHAAECDFLQGFVGENSNYCKVGGKRAVNSQWIPYISGMTVSLVMPLRFKTVSFRCAW